MTAFTTALPRAILVAGTALSLAACTSTMSDDTSSAASAAPAAATDTAQARLLDASGRDMGFVRLSPSSAGMDGFIEVSGISPGEHGMHIHTTGRCDAPDFQTAGGHLNPTGTKHGLSNPAGPHQGDLPQLTVGSDGKGTMSFSVSTTLAALFDADGAAFIVHAGPDDQMTDPSGNSGARILCGVLSMNSAAGS